MAQIKDMRHVERWEEPGTLARDGEHLMRKVRFLNDGPRGGAERMWVHVADDAARSGMLMNDPAILTWCKYRDTVFFGDDFVAHQPTAPN